MKLLAAYVHNDIYNLLFPLAIIDLDKFLSRGNRVVGLQADRDILKAVHGLSCGLNFLHNFERPHGSFHAVHQDIKPKNILIRGTDLVLADFGLSRLKPVEESSQTTWKDATFAYSAPECRDRITWAQGQIGRASDIWSLGCIISDLILYICNGSKGVEEVLSGRSMQDRYGKQDAFHDGKCLKEQVRNALAEVEREADSLATSTLFKLLEGMFAEDPEYRPKAKQVESRLEGIVLQRCIQDMLDTTTKLQENDVHDYQESLRMEIIRFRAWAGAFGLISVRQQIDNPTPQIPASFVDFYKAFESTVKSLASLDLFGPNEKNRDLGLVAIRQFNNTIYDLPQTLRAKAGGLVAVLFTVDASPQSLAISQATVAGYENTSRIATIKHMSSLISQQSEDFDGSIIIEYSQIEEDIYSGNFDAHPKVYWYNIPQDQKQRVLVEWKDYTVGLR